MSWPLSSISAATSGRTSAIRSWRRGRSPGSATRSSRRPSTSGRPTRSGPSTTRSRSRTRSSGTRPSDCSLRPARTLRSSAYNVLFLFAYALAFLGAYLLARELGVGLDRRGCRRGRVRVRAVEAHAERPPPRAVERRHRARALPPRPRLPAPQRADGRLRVARRRLADDARVHARPAARVSPARPRARRVVCAWWLGWLRAPEPRGGRRDRGRSRRPRRDDGVHGAPVPPRPRRASGGPEDPRVRRDVLSAAPQLPVRPRRELALGRRDPPRASPAAGSRRRCRCSRASRSGSWRSSVSSGRCSPDGFASALAPGSSCVPSSRSACATSTARSGTSPRFACCSTSRRAGTASARRAASTR